MRRGTVRSSAYKVSHKRSKPPGPAIDEGTLDRRAPHRSAELAHRHRPEGGTGVRLAQTRGAGVGTTVTGLGRRMQRRLGFVSVRHSTRTKAGLTGAAGCIARYAGLVGLRRMATRECVGHGNT